MGKVILCTGKIAKKPYQFKSSKTLIYTIEELCFYIYHNVDTITDELLNKELIAFIKEELDLVERANFLENLIDKKAGIKDVIVSIFCSADYYSEVEIKQFLSKIDLLYSLNIAQRKKRHADYCLINGQFREAMREYQMILNSKESQDLSHKEYGDILHNIAVLEVKLGAFRIAAQGFLEAYERNGREESLKQYMFALKLGEQDEIYKREMNHFKENKSFEEMLEKEIFQVYETFEYTSSYQKIQEIKKLSVNDKRNEYNQLANQMLEKLMQNYRLESI